MGKDSWLRKIIGRAAAVPLMAPGILPATASRHPKEDPMSPTTTSAGTPVLDTGDASHHETCTTIHPDDVRVLLDWVHRAVAWADDLPKEFGMTTHEKGAYLILRARVAAWQREQLARRDREATIEAMRGLLS